MHYLTALASSPVYDFPYSAQPVHTTPFYNNDIDAILSSITPVIADVVPYQSPSFTLHCVPQINSSVGSNATVYQVSEHIPIETVLRQFGVDLSTLQPSNSVNNYYQSGSQPIDLTIHSSPHRRRRRLVCREVSDSEDDDFHHRSAPRHHHQRQRHHSGPSQPQDSPAAIHNLLGRVWDKVRNSPDHLAPSTSAPSLNWQSGQNRSPSPPPPNQNTNNTWEAMRNAPSPASQPNRNAVNNVWNRAAGANQQNSSGLSNIFNRMRQPSGGIVHSPPPMPNREAVHDFNALRNLPPGINQPRAPSPMPPPNREALNNFLAARHLPQGINQPPPMPPPPPQNREALNNFLAARHLPLGINQPPPPPNQAATNNFFAARNIAPGINQPPPPPQNQEALKNFFAARHVPSGINQPNPAVANVWNRADHAATYPPAQPPMNNAWNQMASTQPYRPQPTFPFPAYGGPLRGPSSVPAPASFAALLSQSHRQHSPYAGSL